MIQPLFLRYRLTPGGFTHHRLLETRLKGNNVTARDETSNLGKSDLSLPISNFIYYLFFFYFVCVKIELIKYDLVIPDLADLSKGTIGHN